MADEMISSSLLVQELKGFQKVLVKAGETGTVKIIIPVKELAYYDVNDHKWVIESGTYNFRIGNSSRDIKTEVSIQIK